jgi:hypothetical protein
MPANRAMEPMRLSTAALCGHRARAAHCELWTFSSVGTVIACLLYFLIDLDRHLL